MTQPRLLQHEDLPLFTVEPEPTTKKQCKHPPTRLYAWRAYDNTLCVACCECGEVLKGGA
jgi:hypothetical protein